VALGIKGRQVTVLTIYVFLVVAALSLWFLTSVANVLLQETNARAELVINATTQYLFGMLATPDVATSDKPLATLHDDQALLSILQGGMYSPEVTYAAIVDPDDVIVAHNDTLMVGSKLEPTTELKTLIDKGRFAQSWGIWTAEGATMELRSDLILGNKTVGSVHVGINSLLLRSRFVETLRTPLITAVLALVGTVFIALVLTQIIVRPIHIVSSAFARLGRGELDVSMELPRDSELGDLGDAFKAVSARLAADRTEKVEKRAALESLLGRLSAGFAHEIKNPLNATAIHLELLKMQLADQPEALDHLATIANQVRRLDEVAQGFLRFARFEDLKLEPVNLHSLFEHVLPVIQAEAEKSGVEVRLECPDDLAVQGDAALLEQAFLNLGLNGCQAMPQGGRLRLAAAAKSPEQLEIVIEDTGVGIAPEHLARIFDLYFTTKEHGSGIGLSLVYRTVQLHDGEIQVESTPGRGTTFRITLPRAEGL
jgi:signal transduction histidine kinase